MVSGFENESAVSATNKRQYYWYRKSTYDILYVYIPAVDVVSLLSGFEDESVAPKYKHTSSCYILLYTCMHYTVYVHTYVCMHACDYVHIHTVYVCMYVCWYTCIFMYTCMYVCTFGCTMYTHLYVCMYIIMYVCMYVCIYVCKRYLKNQNLKKKVGITIKSKQAN